MKNSDTMICGRLKVTDHFQLKKNGRWYTVIAQVVEQVDYQNIKGSGNFYTIAVSNKVMYAFDYNKKISIWHTVEDSEKVSKEIVSGFSDMINYFCRVFDACIEYNEACDNIDLNMEFTGSIQIIDFAEKYSVSVEDMKAHISTSIF